MLTHPLPGTYTAKNYWCHMLIDLKYIHSSLI